MMLCVIAGLCRAEEPGIDYRAIGRQIWINGSEKQPYMLVRWTRGRAYADMGLGFIWYPAGKSGAADESFPKFITFAEAQGITAPDFLRGVAPWADFAAFQADKSDMKKRMMKWLADHLDVQAKYLIAQVHASLPAMLRHAHKPRHVQACYESLTMSEQGMLCLADYLSFMSDGAQPNSPRTGLLQVLEEMREPTPGTSSAEVVREFCRAAELVLRRHAETSPNEKSATVMLMAQLKRIRTYARD